MSDNKTEDTNDSELRPYNDLITDEKDLLLFVQQLVRF
jgi:hypothetical protein